MPLETGHNLEGDVPPLDFWPALQMEAGHNLEGDVPPWDFWPAQRCPAKGSRP